MNKYLFVIGFVFTLFFSASFTFALGETAQCFPNDNLSNHGCDSNLYCKPFAADPNRGSCERVIGETGICNPRDGLTNHGCASSFTCMPTSANPNVGSCEKPPSPAAPGQPAQPAAANPFAAIFGKIQPPDALKGLLGDRTGAGGISAFVSALIALFYSIAGIVLVFMLLWGAFDWMISGGEKEHIAAARNRIIAAIIGIILFAIAFAVIQIIGNFTGFKFFVGQR